MPDIKKMSDEDLFALERADIAAELKRRGYEHGWYKPQECAGVIYVLVNPAFPNLVKIGYADDVAKRLKSLNRSSGLPDPFHCYATYSVKKRLEDLRLHSLIDMLDPDLRHADNREFFEMGKEDAYRILSAIAQINGDEDRLQVNPLGDDYFDGDDVPGGPLQPKDKKREGRLTFGALGIPVGSSLTFSEDAGTSVTTVDDGSTVRLPDGTQCKMSAAVRVFKEAAGTGNASGSYQGGKFFLYEGELLTDRRKRLGA